MLNTANTSMLAKHGITNEVEGYQYIFNVLANGDSWVKIPLWLTEYLGFRSGMGIAGRTLQMKVGYESANNFVKRMNKE